MTDVTPASVPLARPHGAHVYVTVADHGGWDIHVELDGRGAMTEHCTDWHRVERHRARLEAQFRRPAAEQGDAVPAAA